MSERPRTERLFIALELPEELRARLGQLRTADPDLARELRWARGQGLHVTLKFLGNTAPERRDGLVEALESLEPGPPFELACRGLGIFGTPRRPRVLWAGLEGDLAALSALQAKVERVCAALGWPEERREFRPHVTLARPRSDDTFTASSSLETMLARYRDRLFAGFTAETVSLFRSQPGPGGAIYTPVFSLSLRGRQT